MKVCKRHGNSYTDCYIDELIVRKPRRNFANEDKALSWIENKIEKSVDERYHTINFEHIETDNPYIEYRCLGGVGYHLRFNLMVKAIAEMSRNLDRALPNAKGTSFKTIKVRECFLPRIAAFVPH